MTCLESQDLRRLTRGELSRDEALAARKHLAGCDACSNRLDEVEVHHEEERTLGRYVMLDELGRGGMGSVVRAFDPQLERFVAVKRLLDTGATAEARQRLVREAQAMARVVDPHLVAVFDAGIDARGEVYLVMEFVKGPTLAQWLTEAKRTWREVLVLFLQAGKGLSAAHAAGLVHRDFKPSNVLVQDGVAKVTDFGLALAHEPSSAPTLPGSPAARPGGVSSRVTQQGVNAGTPAFMAPEQFDGRFDARSDQFSFARSLEDSLQPGAAPRWVHDALRRALGVDPATRYPSMNELLEALSLERRARRNTSRWLAVATVLVLGAGAGLSRARRVDCETAVAPMQAVWTDGARGAFTRAMAQSPERVARATEGAFANWASSWSERSKASCEASAAGAQGARVELLRRFCLERRLVFFSTVVSQVEAGAVHAEQLAGLVEGLPPIDCTDEELLQTGATEEPEALSAQLQPVRKQLEAVEAYALLGNLTVATKTAREALAAARGIAHGPVVAQGAILLGQRLVVTDPEEARRLFEEAFQLTSAVRAPTQQIADLAARASLELLESYVATPPTFEALRPVVEASIARAGGGRRWEAAYLNYLGRALLGRGDAEGAIAPLQRSYELRLAVAGPDSERTETARADFALALETAGRLDEAIAHRQALVQGFERRYGPTSMVAARALANLGAIEVVAVRYADARKHLETASSLLASANETEELLVVLDNLASLAELSGDFAAARPLREKLLESTRDPLARGKQLALASRVAFELRDVAAARAQALEAQTLLSAVSGEHPDLIVALTTLGRLSARGEGTGYLERALALDSARDGEYRGDAELAMAQQVTDEKTKASWLKRARASYEESEVKFRVALIDAALAR